MLGWGPAPLGTAERPHAGSTPLGSSADSVTAWERHRAAVGPQYTTLTTCNKE